MMMSLISAFLWSLKCLYNGQSSFLIFFSNFLSAFFLTIWGITDSIVFWNSVIEWVLNDLDFMMKSENRKNYRKNSKISWKIIKTAKITGNLRDLFKNMKTVKKPEVLECIIKGRKVNLANSTSTNWTNNLPPNQATSRSYHLNPIFRELEITKKKIRPRFAKIGFNFLRAPLNRLPNPSKWIQRGNVATPVVL